MQHFVTMITFRKMFFTNIFEERIIFFYLGCYRKRHGSVLFLLEVLSLKNEGVIAVFPKITFMTSRDRKCVRAARQWRHAVRILLSIISVFT